MSKRCRSLIVLSLLCICVIFVVLLAGFICKYDRVDISVKHIPVDVEFTYLVASDGIDEHPMSWTVHNELGMPFELQPFKCVASFVDESEHDEMNRTVKWKRGIKYGLVTKSRMETWRVHWFQESDLVATKGLVCFFHGKVAIDIREFPPRPWQGPKKLN